MPKRIITLIAVVAAVATLTGCAERVEWQPASGAWSTERIGTALESKAAQGDAAGSAAGKPVADAPKLRKTAMVRLRSKGDDAATVADLVTRSLPPNDRSVPYFFAKGTFEDRDAIVVFEHFGPPGGKLTARRAWVLSPEGDLLYAAAR